MESEPMRETSPPAVAAGQPSVSSDSALIRILTLLVRRKMFLLVSAAVGGLLALVVAFWLTPMYTATAVIMPPPKAQSLSSAMMGQLSAVAGSLSPALGVKDPADLQIGILRSRTVNETLVSRFDLTRQYSVKTRTDALKELADRASFVSGKDSLIRISVEDADPKQAADLANAYVAELHNQNNRLALTESAQRRLFFERALQDEKEKLAGAEERLKQTQVKTGALQLSSQAEGVIRLIAQLQAEIAAREVQFQRLKMGATAQNPEVTRQENEIAVLRSHLAKLESGDTKSRPGDPIIPFGRVPHVGLESLRMLRDVKYHESLFEVLAKQYEAAKIDEAKESQAIQIVDAAVPPERKSWPPRALLVVLGTITFTLISVVYVLVEQMLAQRLSVESARSK